MRFLFVIIIASLAIPVATAHLIVKSNLTSNNDVTHYYRCVQTAKKFCRITFESQAERLIKTCKVLVIHSQDINQIKNTKSCTRKVD